MISHGHTRSPRRPGGSVPNATAAASLPLVVHPEAWRERKVVFPSGAELRLPPPSRSDLEREGVEVVEERGRTLLLDDAVLVSGQVERSTPFEHGFPIHHACSGGEWQPDPLIVDDQNVIVNVKGKGLVIVSGCSHAGAVNVLETHSGSPGGADRGLHRRLPPDRRPLRAVIEPTVEAFTRAQVGTVLPAHCTGWKAGRASPEPCRTPSSSRPSEPPSASEARGGDGAECRAAISRTVDRRRAAQTAEEVVLTGSVARGVADDVSDIEMLIVTREELEPRGLPRARGRAPGVTHLGTWGPQGGPHENASPATKATPRSS